MPKATTSKQTAASGSQSRSGKPLSLSPYGDKDFRSTKVSYQDADFTFHHGRYYYDTFFSNCATAAHLLVLVREAPRRSDLTKIYGIDLSDVLPIGEDAALANIIRKALARPITAYRLRELILRGNNSAPDSRIDLANALRGVKMPDLEAIKILRKGYSCRYFEEAGFDLLTECGESGKLKHVSLQWHCTYGAGFTKWLESDATAKLITLRLQTNADVRTRITDALVRGHRFPQLRRLSLVNIRGLTPQRLLDTLQTRDARMDKRRRLDVDITAEVSKEVKIAGHKIHVYFHSVDETLLENAKDH
ncbi:uncharacterized protein SCHCODRAFT_02689892 [Schizophyllum commune H4-8]|uniref:Uncharacterized protein n=1 Tax=Schizophyllum commune (strain H4-8 / FGSC 9210) TaxID=578458 RepID=D8Q6T9_SCHCM|nr:uncharacterized protein SCHCODRAFT_02689892 [Schizophyllum commune H4-8]KAI5891775.1 hypothetical protein SCHCODRAFT_02689892 [Schizophyllum commune H4-8]